MVLIQGKPVFQVWFGGPVWLLQFLMMIMMADPFAIGGGVLWEGKGMDRTHRWGKIIFAFLRMDHHMLIFIMVTVLSASLSSCLSYSLPPVWWSSQYKPRPGQVQLFLVLWRRGVPSEGSEAPTGEWWRWLQSFCYCDGDNNYDGDDGDSGDHLFVPHPFIYSGARTGRRLRSNKLSPDQYNRHRYHRHHHHQMFPIITLNKHDISVPAMSSLSSLSPFYLSLHICNYQIITAFVSKVLMK